MADESQDLPYKAEYAKSGRSKCKGCKESISQGCLRLAAMVQSPMFDAKVPNWYHHMCFFSKQRPQSIGDIDSFDNLRWEDQEKIKKKLEEVSGLPVASKGKSSKRKNNNLAAKDFNVEYAKSSRAKCRGCEVVITKGEIRISKKDFQSDIGKRFGGQDMWHHVECFTKMRNELKFFESADCINGFSELKKEDQAMVKKSLPKVDASAIVKDEVDGQPEIKKPKKEEKDPEEEDLLKKQNKLLFKYKDQLVSLSSKELTSLLEENGQQDAIGNQERIERIADCMAFGSLAPCDVCNDGQLVFKSGIGYQCDGNISEWTKCLKINPDPKRSKFVIPSDLQEDHKFLSKYKCKIGKRVFRREEKTAVVSKDVTDDGPKVNRKVPLRGMTFCIVGKVEGGKENVKKKILKLGGQVVKTPNKETTAIISNKKEVEGDYLKSEIEDARSMGIHVVPESFLDKAENEDAVDLISKMELSSWGKDIASRILVQNSTNKSSKSKSIYTKSVPKSVTLTVKGGTAVDPDSGKEDVAHVYVKGKDVYSVVLSKTNVQKDQNSYYKLQILESDTSKTYWVFRSWGRIGTTIGGNKCEHMHTLAEAIKEFKSHYQDKTGNKFEDRENFVKQPGLFNPVDMDFGESESMDLDGPSVVPSKLHDQVQELVKLLFNVDLMKNVMKQFQLDLEKMPLGKLSKKQLLKAYSVLGTLQSKEGDIKPITVIDSTNQFYTLIPHNFGVEKPPLLDNNEIIQEKIKMIDSLLEMETAYTLIKECDSEDKEHHPIDRHYHKLKAEIEPIDLETEEYRIIDKYVRNTHGKTHTSYELEISQLYKINRKGESKRFKPFKKLHRKLLWHGSRTTNFAGIISQGLRIAPPEAPVTGYMFGKGIYFADMVSKSANYCMTDSTNNTGLLLLCEVALGEMYERTQAEYVEKLPSGKHSTKGVGVTCPDPSGAIMLEDGLEVPAGKGIQTVNQARTSLLYNEYIVYDPAQVKARYLLKVNFKYKY